MLTIYVIMLFNIGTKKIVVVITMESFNFEEPFNNTDLNIYQCGSEICNSEHSYGPAVRDHFLFHYIVSGKGIFFFFFFFYYFIFC